ncbi:hypothetical protein HRS9139_06116 [Pyrenophora teres f. teres]|nr:hypothetical protein HRS9139_06116 [Pyrenophora teres f. teres]
MKIFLGTVTFLALFQMGLAYPRDILDPRRDTVVSPEVSPVPREANVALEFAAAKRALGLNAETALAAARVVHGLSR